MLTAAISGALHVGIESVREGKFGDLEDRGKLFLESSVSDYVSCYLIYPSVSRALGLGDESKVLGESVLSGATFTLADKYVKWAKHESTMTKFLTQTGSSYLARVLEQKMSRRRDAEEKKVSPSSGPPQVRQDLQFDDDVILSVDINRNPALVSNKFNLQPRSANMLY